MSDQYPGYIGLPGYGQDPYAVAAPQVDLLALQQQMALQQPAGGTIGTGNPMMDLALAGGALYGGKKVMGKLRRGDASKAGASKLSLRGLVNRAGMQDAIPTPTGGAAATPAQAMAQAAQATGPVQVPQLQVQMGRSIPTSNLATMPVNASGPMGAITPGVNAADDAGAALARSLSGGTLPRPIAASPLNFADDALVAGAPKLLGGVTAGAAGGESAALGAVEGAAGRSGAARLAGLAPGLSSPLRMTGATIAAPIAGNLMDRLDVGGHNSLLDQAATGGAAGATAGAFIGGPLGAAVGGVAGAGLNVGYNKVRDWLGGGGGGDKGGGQKAADALAKDRSDLQGTMISAFNQLGIDPRQQSQFSAQISLAGMLEKDPKKAAALERATAAQLLAALPQYAQQTQQAQRQQAGDQAYLSSAQQFVKPYLDMQQTNSALAAQNYRDMAAKARTPLEKQAYEQQASLAELNGARAQAQFAQQLAGAPYQMATARQQQENDARMAQVASLIWGQGVSSLYGQPKASSIDSLATG